MLTNCLTASTHLSSTVFQLFKLQVQKIAVFTYCSLHFCFPWRRPCDYHAICCMDGKTIQGLPNPSQQVPIYHGLYVCIILYANDILLLAPSVNALQLLLSTCELELRKLDLFINSAKSVCLRIGPRRSNNWQNLVNINENSLNWESCIRYLGVYIECAGHFRCSHEVAKRKFYSSFNGIFGKIGRVASEEVILNLISAKCNVYPACCMHLRHCHSILHNSNHSGFLLSAFCSKCLKLGLLISLASAKNFLIFLMFQN